MNLLEQYSDEGKLANNEVLFILDQASNKSIHEVMITQINTLIAHPQNLNLKVYLQNDGESGSSTTGWEQCHIYFSNVNVWMHLGDDEYMEVHL